MAVRGSQSGMSFIELVIVLAIMGILLALGASGMMTWMRNAKLKATAEAILNGLQVAKAEAVRRNTVVRFQLVSSLRNDCTLGTAASTDSFSNWVISRDDPADPAVTARCASALIAEGVELGNTVAVPAPAIIRTRGAAEGSSNVVVVAGTSDTLGQPFVSFNGMGRIPAGVLAGNLVICVGADEQSPSSAVAIEVDAGVARCVVSPTERRMQISLTPGGQIRMCDPAFPIGGTDPQRCF